MTKKDVGELVRKYLPIVPEYLKDQFPAGISITVLEDAIREERGFWYVPVLPSAQPRKMYAYYEGLAEVESQLDENDHLNVLLVPVIPEEADAMTAPALSA